MKTTTAFMTKGLMELTEDAYISGLNGAPWYPLDAGTEIANMEGFAGRELSPIGRMAVVSIVAGLNRAYEQGCKNRAV